jgi:hypothetical protein
MAGCCKCDNEPFDSTQFWECLELTRNCQLLRNDSTPCSYTLRAHVTETQLFLTKLGLLLHF